MSDMPEVGQRIEAVELLSWTLDEFEDQPLVIYPGGQGTVSKVFHEEKAVRIVWDEDQHQAVHKLLTLVKEPDNWPIKVVG